MKVAALREVKEAFSKFVERAQKERVLVTRHGKPAALVIGVEGQDLESLLTASDPNFWAMIERRRREPTISLGELEERLERTRPGRPRATARKRGRSQRRRR
jgi:prevent-host-death family protein